MPEPIDHLVAWHLGVSSHEKTSIDLPRTRSQFAISRILNLTSLRCSNHLMKLHGLRSHLGRCGQHVLSAFPPRGLGDLTQSLGRYTLTGQCSWDSRLVSIEAQQYNTLSPLQSIHTIEWSVPRNKLSSTSPAAINQSLVRPFWIPPSKSYTFDWFQLKPGLHSLLRWNVHVRGSPALCPNCPSLLPESWPSLSILREDIAHAVDNIREVEVNIGSKKLYPRWSHGVPTSNFKEARFWFTS